MAELDASRHEISRLSAAHGALAERERLAREIHDTLAQGFTSLLMLVQAVEAELDSDLPQARRHLALMDETARRNLAEARALVAGGAPADLAGASLPDALARLAARHEAPLDVTGPVRTLPAGIEVVTLRSCQEALTNARRHTGSSAAVHVALAYTDDTVTVTCTTTAGASTPPPSPAATVLPGCAPAPNSPVCRPARPRSCAWWRTAAPTRRSDGACSSASRR